MRLAPVGSQQPIRKPSSGLHRDHCSLAGPEARTLLCLSEDVPCVVGMWVSIKFSHHFDMIDTDSDFLSMGLPPCASAYSLVKRGSNSICPTGCDEDLMNYHK